MALTMFSIVFFVMNVHLNNFKTDAECIISRTLVERSAEYIAKTSNNPPKEALYPPTNNNSSIGYRMYSQKNLKNPCFLEPNTEALENCPIDSAYQTVFLIHGFLVDFNIGNFYEVIKDLLLERESLNVIIVDWTKYDKPPYELAVKNMYAVADEVVKLIKFLVKYAGIQTEHVTISGHSLGAHLAGAIGKQIPSIGRIDGLDPAGSCFESPLSNRLSYTDANYVQVMHTSEEKNGIGLYESIGHMDFYVNGGKTQPPCSYGRRFQKPSGDFTIVNNHSNFGSCNHEIALNYYINSINSSDCTFLATKCNSYHEFQEGDCTPQNSAVGELGFFGSKIPGLPPYSNFYLETGSENPYCLKDGFLSKKGEVLRLGAATIGSGPVLKEFVSYVFESIKNPIKELLNPPMNRNSSIGYRVYTRNNPKNPCFLEPNKEFLKNCPIDSAFRTVFIIHGLLVDLNPGNLFEVAKDVFLEREALNVIIVDWTKYDKPPYELAILNVYIIADKVAELIKFLVKYAGIQTENITISGHSLGAHMAGAIGKQIPNIGRIDGLEPAGPYYESSVLNRLSYTDANFVQVMHTSDTITGLGLHESIGDMDFYVNGGRLQPHCLYGSRFQRPSGDFAIVSNDILYRFCNHEVALSYYINTINSTSCTFFGSKCNFYHDFEERKCTPENSVVAELGAFGSKIRGLPPYSNFYLRTSSESPYCLQDGYLP